MKSALPKIAAVVFTVASVAMMGTSIAAYFNRLDHTAQMGDPLIQDYEFASATSDGTTTWTVTPSVGDDRTARTKSTGYAALQEAFKHKTTRLNTTSSEMEQLTATLIEQEKQVSAEQLEDDAALEKRVQQLSQVVAGMKDSYLQLSKQHQDLITESQAVRAETADRREDVIRLKTELNELRTDRYRLEELRRGLTDRLVRLQLENQAIEKRLQQVAQQTK